MRVHGDDLDRVDSDDLLQFLELDIFQDERPHVVAEAVRAQLALKQARQLKREAG